MITHVCVAIQLLGAPAAPDAQQALQQHCDDVLGAGECRLTSDGKNDDKTECWRATLVRTVDDAMASVVVVGSGAAAGRVAQRDVKFQSNDDRTERWATLGLVIAALVTQEEHALASTPPPAGATATPAPEKPLPAGKTGISRDVEAEPATISEELEEPSREPLHLADVRLLGVADVGRLPWATVGPRVAATSAVTRHLDVEIGFAYLTSTGMVGIPTSAGGVGLHFNLFSVTLGLCRRSRASTRLTGHACVGGDLAEVSASPGQALPPSQHVWLPNAWVGFDSALRLTHHLALVAEFKAEVALAGPFAVATTDTVIFQSSRLTENIALGIAGTF